jgi:hypothetical protein
MVEKTSLVDRNEGLSNHVVKLHTATAGSRIPTSFSLI